jgi:hypothetical protein
MSRLRSRVLFAAGLSASLVAGLSAAESTGATTPQTTSPDAVAETVVEVITSEVVVETVVEGVDVAEATSVSALGGDVPAEALLTVEDVGSGWETDGPEVVEFGPTAEPFSYCPNGAEMLPPVAGASISFTPAPAVEDVLLFDDEVVEGVFVFSTAQDVVSWFDGLESCVGQEWEESFDPVEQVTLETLEVPDLGDESRGFVTTYAHSGESEHDNTAILVRLGEVLVLVSYDNYGLDEAVDQAFFDGLVETAVAKVEATLG